MLQFQVEKRDIVSVQRVEPESLKFYTGSRDALPPRTRKCAFGEKGEHSPVWLHKETMCKESGIVFYYGE